MDLKPTFRIIANSSDITAAIASRVIDMSLTDEAGLKSDTLELRLADHDPYIEIPPAGAELEVFLGYEPSPARMGLYIVDEIHLTGWPTSLVIRAKAAPFEASKNGKSDLQTQKTRSWPKGTKIADMVAKIAQEHGMQASVNPDIGAIELPHTDQTEESDLSMLMRIAKRYDAVAKPANGSIVVGSKGKSKSAAGETLPTVVVKASDTTRFQMSITQKDSPGTVIAYWHDKRAAKRQEVTLGSGDPVRRLRHWYQDEQCAKSAARSEMDRRGRGQRQLNIAMPGNPAIVAESPIVATGFRDGVNGNWVVSRATHQYSKTGGYTVDFEAEQAKTE